MFSEETRSAVRAYNHPTPEEPPLLALARDYVRECENFDVLMAQFNKINEELKKTDIVRKEMRAKLLAMIGEEKT